MSESIWRWIGIISLILIATQAWSETIRWTPATGDPDGYRIQKSVNGQPFEEIAQVAPEINELDTVIGANEVTIFRVGAVKGEATVWSEESDVVVGSGSNVPVTQVPSAPGRPIIIIIQ